MNSWNHSIIHSCLITRLNTAGYIALPELTLSLPDSHKGIKPDIAVYPKPGTIDWVHDVSKVERLPVLIVEIVSPRQNIQCAVDKIDRYIASKITSWLVHPFTRSVMVSNNGSDLVLSDSLKVVASFGNMAESHQLSVDFDKLFDSGWYEH